MIALAGENDENDDAATKFVVTTEEHQEEEEIVLFGGSKNAMRIVGIVVMIFVAFNDASLNVLARTMKDLHYSLIQFWFSAIGLGFLVIYLIIACCVKNDWPDMFYYNKEQLVVVALTGVFSALNLTCLVIAY